LEKKHPQMWHEVARHPVIRVVKKNFHKDGYSRLNIWKPF
jgi:hypothetical protein